MQLWEDENHRIHKETKKLTKENRNLYDIIKQDIPGLTKEETDDMNALHMKGSNTTAEEKARLASYVPKKTIYSTHCSGWGEFNELHKIVEADENYLKKSSYLDPANITFDKDPAQNAAKRAKYIKHRPIMALTEAEQKKYRQLKMKSYARTADENAFIGKNWS